MVKKETYITCTNKNVFEGMTSISAIIQNHNPGYNRKIERIYFDSAQIKRKSRELSFLKRNSELMNFDIEFKTNEEITELTTGNTHGGIIAICSDRTIPSLSEATDEISKNGVYIMLDGVEDPYNFGYSIRSIYASGADGIIVPERNWFDVAGIVAKSSAGASELINTYVSSPEKAVEIFKSLGYKIVCAGIRDSVSMYDADMKKPILLIVGGEKRGISSYLIKMSDQVVRIDYGKEFRGSLSTASAATILSYEVFRQNKDLK